MNQTSMYTSINNTIKQVQNKKEQSKSGKYIIYTIFTEKKSIYAIHTREGFMMPRLFVCLYFFYVLNVFIGKFNEMEVNGRRVGWNILITISSYIMHVQYVCVQE